MPLQMRQIPKKLIAPGGTTALYVPDDQFDQLLSPQNLDMPICGFMDREGKIHYEVSAPRLELPTGVA